MFVLAIFFLNPIRRFGEIPTSRESPPLSDKLQNGIMDIELQILGSLTLPGTDAPEEFGFTVNFGNKVHICLEPQGGNREIVF